MAARNIALWILPGESGNAIELSPVNLGLDLSESSEIVISPSPLIRALKTGSLWVREFSASFPLGSHGRDGVHSGKIDPSLAIANAPAALRQAVRLEGEVVRLYKRAWRMGYKGLAACIATSWDSQLSPIDPRSLTTGQRVDDLQGAIFALARAKTNRPAAGSLGKRATRLLGAYIGSLPFELMPNAPRSRTRGSSTTAKGGKPQNPAPYSKDKLGLDFRVVRLAESGAGETRQLADMRRSGTVEATAGRASAHAISTKMANSLAAATRLQQTNNPVNIATVRDVDASRRKGRAKLRKNRSGRKV